jgi:hypothetical protein
MHTALLVNSALNIKNKNMGTDSNKVHLLKKELTAVVAVQDEDGDWFVIPTDQQEDFRRLAGRINASFGPEDDARFEEEFETKFRKYATGGDLNNVQLYAEI